MSTLPGAMLQLAYALEDMRDRAIRRYEKAEAAIERVRGLHEPITDYYVNRPDIPVCSYCISGGDSYAYPDDAETYPCPTIRAINQEAGE